MTKRLYIGTSGFSYSHWMGIFYPEKLREKDRLKFYAGVFNALEVNVTFYRMLKHETFKKWYRETPDDFVFALKAPRIITHYRRLIEVEQELTDFFEGIKELSEKAKVILWQLPPSLKFEGRLAESFFEAVFDRGVKRYLHALECRNRTWAADEALELLKKYNISLACAHSSRYPCIVEETSNFYYFRFHGPESLFSSRYTENDLYKWAQIIKEKLRKGEVFAFFNNDYGGYAVENALQLKKLIENN